MSIFTGLLCKQSGSVGQLTFRRVNGQTVISEKVTEVSNPQTEAQMKQRTKWLNLVAFYQGIKPMLNKGFESKTATQNDFNMFMKINLQQTPVYITKEQKAAGACVASAYQITQGSLPAIVTDKTSGWNAVTDIAIGGMEIDSETTIGDFSKAVVNNNSDYKYGDQITYYTVIQKVNESTGIPYCVFKAYIVVLDASNTDKLWDKVLKNGFYAQNGYIGHGPTEGDNCYAWVHSRKGSSKTLVSSQTLIDNNSKLADYQSDTVFASSAKSYGATFDDEAILTPNASNIGEVGSGSSSGSSSSDSGASDDDQSI